jgi:hypothetical protein
VEDSEDATVNSGPVNFNNKTYENSLSVTCPQGGTDLAYDVDGASFLNATIGIPDNAQNAAGVTTTVTFFKNGPSTQLAAPINVSVGKPQVIHLDLNGASQLDFTCAAVNNATQNSMQLVFALGSAQLTNS